MNRIISTIFLSSSRQTRTSSHRVKILPGKFGSVVRVVTIDGEVRGLIFAKVNKAEGTKWEVSIDGHRGAGATRATAINAAHQIATDVARKARKAARKAARVATVRAATDNQLRHWENMDAAFGA